MSRLSFTLLGIIVLAVFLCLGTYAQTSVLGGREWKLERLNGTAVSGDTRATIEFDTQKNRFSGNAGCNRMFGKYSSGKGKLKFSAVGTTRMACLGKVAEQEAEFVKTLGQASGYRVSGNILKIYSGKKAVLGFTAIYKQNGEEPGAGRTGLEDRKWVLESIEGKPIANLKTEAFITLDATKQSAGGNTGCNVFGGSYAASGDKLRFSQIISTMRACIEDDRMSIERALLGGLEKADRYKIRGETLEIYGGKKMLLVFAGKAKD